MEAKMDMDEENYVESFKPHLMDVVHAWSSVRDYNKSVYVPTYVCFGG